MIDYNRSSELVITNQCFSLLKARLVEGLKQVACNVWLTDVLSSTPEHIVEALRLHVTMGTVRL